MREINQKNNLNLMSNNLSSPKEGWKNSLKLIEIVFINGVIYFTSHQFQQFALF